MQENAKEFAEMIYFVPEAFAKEGGMWLLRAGRNIAKPEYQVGPIMFQYHNFHFVMEGKVEFTFGGQQVALVKGDVFCMYPGIAYQYRYLPDDKRLRMIWISFDGPQVPASMATAGFRPTAPYLRQVMTKELQHTLEQVFVPPTDGFKRHLEHQASLYRMFSHLMPEDEASVSDEGPDYWIPRSINYMNTHYMEHISVQDVADFASVHRGYFSKVFTQKVGMSPVRYLERLKMEKAMELLQSATYSISEIGMTLGYPDPYTFTRAFSRYSGMPPGKWRKTHGGQQP